MLPRFWKCFLFPLPNEFIAFIIWQPIGFKDGPRNIFLSFLVLLLFTQRSLKYHLIFLFSFSSLHHFSNTILQYQTLWSLRLLRTSARNICRLWMLLPYTKLLLLNFTHPPPLTVTLFLTSHTFFEVALSVYKAHKAWKNTLCAVSARWRMYTVSQIFSVPALRDSNLRGSNCPLLTMYWAP